MKIFIIGIGMGTQTLTQEANMLFENADVVIGHEGVIKRLGKKNSLIIYKSKLEEMANAVKKCLEDNLKIICIAVSGDVGFYSGANFFLTLLDGLDVRLINGISTPQVLAAKLKRPWESFHLVSAHGKDCNIVLEVTKNKEVFLLTDNINTPAYICKTLVENNLGNVVVYVGENLYGENEEIKNGTALEMSCQNFSLLSAMLIENKNIINNFKTHGIQDKDFIRDKIPMTKREIRSIALSMLKIKENDILWDIGAGSGSVSVEMALLASNGKVFSIEKNIDAIDLIKKNKKKFYTNNLEIIAGEAPEVLNGLPKPNAVFIGGTSGNLKNILEFLKKENLKTRVLITAITLETLTEANNYLKHFNFINIEIIEAQISRLEPLGNYNMFKAQNPVFILYGEDLND